MFVCYYLGNDMFEVKKETPIQGNSPPTREKTNSRVNPGNVLNNRLSLESIQVMYSITGPV